MRFIVLFISLFWLSFAQANNNVLDDLIKPNQPVFLKVDQAFKHDFDQQGKQLFLAFDIADGYYLYKQKLQFVAKEATLIEPTLPEGEMIEDEYFGKTDVYFGEFVTVLKFSEIKEGAVLKIRYQGCAEAGLCYPPETITIPLVSYTTSPNSEPSSQAEADKTSSTDSSLTERLADQSLLTNLAVFFLLGLGLALTPCVFPMFPILSSLIAGQSGVLSTKKAFMLSFIYVQGMAITYAALGLVVAKLGGHITGYLQHPILLISFSILFVVLACSMFGFFDIKLPESWMTRLTQLSNKQKNGQYVGVFLMGILSGLIASPCTTAPLSAALLYVAQSGDYVFGAVTLYVLSLGMGVPLLLMGTSGGKLLPKAGAWMNQVKTLFGFIMLMVPLILLERIVAFDIILILGALLLLATAIYLYYWQIQTQSAKAKTILWTSAFVLAFIGLSVLQNQIFPSSSVVKTSSGLQTAPASNEFINVSNLSELDNMLARAQQENKLVMLDLYAEWCVACKEFEHKTFPDERVQGEFEHYMLLKADLTESDDVTMEFMERFTVFGLPSILFFDLQGNELSEQRVTGFLNATDFSEHLEKLRHSQNL
ncbi:protein-disulfide reductase DsbD [Pseudoalteromonas ulvae]|uniref:Thiol:disulfide interchange protein DsbD n=1 Tax=Pseudoalteromonas ulvae TaxID=107327 RepID=A0A244CQ18_PSEDV|nr:protein-disulfide reductase DsbD [Pseudoalteromonas ulvae]OUL57299.1 protein-disulfide reductase DsbD [Pseudoalteromonas ulvae]